MHLCFQHRRSSYLLDRRRAADGSLVPPAEMPVIVHHSVRARYAYRGPLALEKDNTAVPTRRAKGRRCGPRIHLPRDARTRRMQMRSPLSRDLRTMRFDRPYDNRERAAQVERDGNLTFLVPRRSLVSVHLDQRR